MILKPLQIKNKIDLNEINSRTRLILNNIDELRNSEKLKKDPYFIIVNDFDTYLTKYNPNLFIEEVNYLLNKEKVKKNLFKFVLCKKSKYFIIGINKFFNFNEIYDFDII